MKFSKNGNWKIYWGAMPLPDGAEAIGTVTRKSNTGALIRLKNGRYVQGIFGSVRTLDQTAVKNAIDRSEAAVSLGRRGGLATSEAKTKAARANAKKGGWPKGKPRK